MGMKVLGGTNLPSYWDRFDRLQETARKLGALEGFPRGVFRFSSFEEFEQWKMDRRLNRLERPTTPPSR
ncbi:MAG: hypothetical protein GVY18_02720 [Bacteroidetes bacterium]|jgi:hypothetical protein|nr:hypothetical protein [Bacteroidota bacterium]